MGKVVVSTFMSLDGVMEAPETWSMRFQAPETMQAGLDLLLGSEALLLGRRTYEGFAAAWPAMSDPMGFADKMNSMDKYVVSSDAGFTPAWSPATVLREDAVAEVRALKQRVAGDLLMYGSATLMRTLMEHDLIDELVLLLCPVVVGDGRRLFPQGTAPTTLALTEATGTSGGMTVLRYVRSAVAAEPELVP